MRPIKFKGSNVVFSKNQKPYKPLPALVFKEDEEGTVVTCWKLNFFERLKVLLTGKIWHSQKTFGDYLQPINKSVNADDFFKIKK